MTQRIEVLGENRRSMVPMTSKDKLTTAEQVRDVYQKYVRHYDGEIQGCCLLIADEIQRAVGGDVVAGELTFFGGTQRRTHWWVDLNGMTLDPMGDDMMSDPRDFAERVEIHRDRAIFDAILPQYEQWRIGGSQ